MIVSPPLHGVLLPHISFPRPILVTRTRSPTSLSSLHHKKKLDSFLLFFTPPLHLSSQSLPLTYVRNSDILALFLLIYYFSFFLCVYYILVYCVLCRPNVPVQLYVNRYLSIFTGKCWKIKSYFFNRDENVLEKYNTTSIPEVNTFLSQQFSISHQSRTEVRLWFCIQLQSLIEIG